MTAAELQNRALVIDGLSYHSDGYTGDLRAGGINALNVTLNHFEADFTESCEKIAGWLPYTPGLGPGGGQGCGKNRPDHGLAKHAPGGR